MASVSVTNYAKYKKYDIDMRPLTGHINFCEKLKHKIILFKNATGRHVKFIF